MTEYGRMAQHYKTGADAEAPTSHLVTDERKTEVDTACGLTLRRVSPVTHRGSYVHNIGDVPMGNLCGNCPWDETGYGDDDP